MVTLTAEDVPVQTPVGGEVWLVKLAAFPITVIPLVNVTVLLGLVTQEAA